VGWDRNGDRKMERRPQKQYKKLVSAAPKKRIGAVHEKKKRDNKFTTCRVSVFFQQLDISRNATHTIQLKTMYSRTG
jgi:hypothetical protein